ncbi:hypothetical protein [Pyxidicoccus xibeiensis]|uniref:hypothetical protein n=1 Tax=Pyxidicoccus xibeiensis TaxID=2906759 RepID=UPI0020A7B331|nr:hypothetical protein [Pyxidicoccus xibeiensis]MCP3144375.1 hypothetical protein [Pyxidicoccus xibeiensis]
METNNSSIPAPALNLSLEQVHKRILKLAEQGHRNAYQIGRLYNYVVDSELAQEGGFKDARDFFRQRVNVVSQAVLSLNGAVARVFTEELALKYGMRNLYTLLAYAKLAGLTVAQDEPGALPIAVPQKDGTLLSKPFADCSVEELQNAMKHKRSPPVPLPEQDVARVQRYRDNLQRHFADRLSIRVDARNHLGELLITLRDIPEKDMRRLGLVLVDESDLAIPGSQVHGSAQNENIPSPASSAQVQGAANDGNARVPALSVAQADDGTAASADVKGQGPSAGSPMPPPPARQERGGPRTEKQGIGGFIRRIAGA